MLEKFNDMHFIFNLFYGLEDISWSTPFNKKWHFVHSDFSFVACARYGRLRDGDAAKRLPGS